MPISPSSLEQERQRWQALRHRVSADVRWAIEARLRRWTQPLKLKPNAPAGKLPAAVLVRRPGLMPRPLDPYFFEVITPRQR